MGDFAKPPVLVLHLPAMATQHRSSRALCGLVLLGALAGAWLAAPGFVQPPTQSPRTEAPSASAPAVLGLTAASWLAASQPALAESDGPMYPALPYVSAFLVIFSVLFIIPFTSLQVNSNADPKDYYADPNA